MSVKEAVSLRSAAAAAALSGFLSLVLFVLVLIPARKLDRVRYSTAVYDRNGVLLRLTLSPDEKFRVRAGTADLPPRFIEALLLKEDRFFYSHSGVNPSALAKAFWHSIVMKDYRAGGSTITMQLARLLYGLDTTTPAGKVRQILLALALEMACPKGRILAAYCSMVPCGRNVEGFPAASLVYLRKPLSSLSLSEMLLLCGIPQLPGSRSPDRASETSLDARAMLYRTWLERHPEDAELAAQFDMPQDFSLSVPFEAPHAVVSLLNRNPGKTRIDSTLDARLQKTMERIVSGYRKRKAGEGVRNACALLVLAKGMEILAEVGSADFFDDSISGQVNGTEAKRSPGSALKPFLYALAMDQSLIHPMTVLKDAPIHFSGYNPDNFDDDFEGPIKAKDALIKSRNVPAVALSQKVKDPDLYDFLLLGGVRGLRGKSDYGVSLALGTAEVTMKELAALYGVLANYGEFRPLSETKTSVSDETGAAFMEHAAACTLLSPEAAFLTLNILQEKARPDWINPITLRSAPRPCAWKTGTSIGFRDAWSVGIFDSFIISVWVGNFDGSGNPAFVGLRSAAPLMFEIVDAIRTSGFGREYDSGEVQRAPVDVIITKVCSVSGKIPGLFCPSVTETLFIPGKSPIETCDIHQEIYIDKRTGLRRAFPIGGETCTVVFEIWPSDILALFEKAGMPRRQPPPFSRDEDLANQSTGRPPQIVSPLPKGEYAFRLSDATRQEMPFLAVVPSDAATVFWFLNESYLGKSQRGKAFFWKPAPGAYVLRATDEHGRSGSCRFTVVARQ